MLQIKWSGPVFSTFSFGEVCRNYVFALDDLGVKVKAQSIREWGGKTFSLDDEISNRLKKLKRRKIAPPYVNITFERPMHAVKEDTAEKNIGFFPFEHELCDKSWIERSSGCDEYWVPSHYNYMGATRSGFDPSKLFVVPHGVDINRFHPGIEPLKFYGQKGFTFLAVSQYNYRKGWDLLIKAFTREFTSDDDVCLVCKTSHPKALYKASLPYLKQKNSPTVIILKHQIDTDQIPSLFTAADCFVLPARAEGWGMCYLEAMASGVPTIGTRFSGNLEFMNDRNSLLIELSEIRPDPEHQMEGNPFNYAEPDLSDLRYKLRRAFEDRELMKNLSTEGLSTAEQFTWIKQAERIRDRCNHILNEDYHPDWKVEIGQLPDKKQSSEKPLVDILLFTNDNTYALSRTLKAWALDDCPARIHLIDTGENPLSDDFIETALSSGFADIYKRINQRITLGKYLEILMTTTSCPYIHITAFDHHPSSKGCLTNALKSLDENPKLAAVGGYVISPYQTIILGPFNQTRCELDRAFVDKGIRIRQLNGQINIQSPARYIHHEAMVLRRSALEKLKGIHSNSRGISLSKEISNLLRALDNDLLIDGSFLIESQRIPGSILSHGDVSK